jgi:hypothetical protein
MCCAARWALFGATTGSAIFRRQLVPLIRGPMHLSASLGRRVCTLLRDKRFWIRCVSCAQSRENLGAVLNVPQTFRGLVVLFSADRATQSTTTDRRLD